VNALAGRVPSSLSVPVPAKPRLDPPVYVAPEVGVVMVAMGGWLLVTVSSASLLVAGPMALVTTALKRAPLSESWTLLRV
jgi:hypothetical protein